MKLFRNELTCALILFMYTQTLEQLGELARDSALSIEALRNGSPVLHASAAIVALLVNTVLSIYKPRGLTAYGRSKQAKPRGVETYKAAVPEFADRPTPKSTSASRRLCWIYVVGIHAIGLALLFLVIHLAGGIPSH